MNYAKSLGLGSEHVSQPKSKEESKKSKMANKIELSKFETSKIETGKFETSKIQSNKYQDDDIFADLPPFDTKPKNKKEQTLLVAKPNKPKQINKLNDKQNNRQNDRQNDKQNDNTKLDILSPNAKLIQTIGNKNNYTQYDASLIIKQADFCKTQIRKSKDILKTLNRDFQLVKIASLSHKTAYPSINSSLDIIDIVEEINDVLSNSKTYWDDQILAAQKQLEDKISEVRTQCVDYQNLRQLQSKILNTFPDKGKYLLDQMAKRDMGSHDDIPVHSEDWDAFNRNFMNTAIHARDEFEDSQDALDYNFGTSIEVSRRF